MTANRRIFLNIVATYGRSLYAFACGLVTARWVLLSLGEVDFGLLGVVGSMTAFVAFLNSLMASSVGRFYAYSYGVSRKSGGKEGLEDCRRWFSLAVAIHTLVPVALMLAGYPAGEWAVRHYLTIPPERIGACVWVWRFACVSCFAGMVSVPFSAMYTAKQEIAELTIYGFCTTTLNVLFLGYMITHPGVWIVKLSAWQCFLAVTPAAIISYRAVKCYPECRFRRAYVRDRERIHQLPNVWDPPPTRRPRSATLRQRRPTPSPARYRVRSGQPSQTPAGKGNSNACGASPMAPRRLRLPECLSFPFRLRWKSTRSCTSG